jgi:hypothetical protein
MTTHQLCRRTFLRGVGVSMALPWLESLRVWGDEARHGTAASEAPVRFAAIFAGNGFHSREWWAKGQGRDLELGKVLLPLHDFREKLLFIQGLHNAEALKGNIHSSQTGNLLSGAPLASGGEIRSGTSIDQVIAQQRSSKARRRKSPASCSVAKNRIPRCTRTTRCFTAPTFPGARRPRPRRWSFIRRWPSTGSSRMK